MKRVKLKDKEIYYGCFSNSSDIANEFSIDSNVTSKIKILYAHYNAENYEGEAHVIFVEDGILYEVNGSHCSCYGLEDQWKPEETNVYALLERPNVSLFAKKNLKKYFKDVLVFC